jgi:hypothetical protein
LFAAVSGAVLCLAALLVAAPCLRAGGGNDGAEFFASGHWDEGKAEFQVYRSAIGKYGTPRDALTKIVIVKEPFDRKKLVKSGASTYSVVKMNYIQVVPTGMYTYYQMASLFFDAATGELVKYSFGSQEGCGNTYFEYRGVNGKGFRTVYSYFDDQGLMREKINHPGALFYDAFPLVLRFRLRDGTTYPVRFIRSLIANKYVRPDVAEGSVSVRTVSEARLGDRTYRGVHKVEVRWSDNVDTLYFEAEYPNALLRWEKAGGDTLTLEKSHFTDYWNRTGDGDHSLVAIE